MTVAEPGSHWHPALMLGSLMTPGVGPPEVTRLDLMTLAALQDTGWYKVNFSAADDLVWGRGAGCVFGTQVCTKKSSEFYHILPTKIWPIL